VRRVSAIRGGVKAHEPTSRIYNTEPYHDNSGGVRRVTPIRGGVKTPEPIPRKYNPDHYYGGNSENKQDGGKRKSKKSKKSKRVVEYGSMMLYGGSKNKL